MHVLLTYDLWDSALVPGHDNIGEVYDAAIELNRLGLEVTVMAGEQEGRFIHQNTPAIRQLCVPRLRVMPLARVGQMPLAALLQCNLSLLAALATQWQGGDRYDVIHCFGWRVGLASGQISAMMKVPLVVSVRDLVPDRSPWMADTTSAYARYVWRWMMRQARALVCPDAHMREKIQDVFLIEEKDQIILPPYCPPSNGMTQNRLLKGEDRIILYVGPLESVGLKYLLETCAVMTARHLGPLKIWLCCPAGVPEHVSIRSIIRRLGLAEQVFFLKPRKQGGWWDQILLVVNLLVLPDPVEFIGNVVLKAAAFGVPILAAQCAAVSDFFREGLSDVTFQHGDRSRLASAMEAILCDEGCRLRITSQERTMAQGWQPMGSQLLSLYERLCAGATARKGGETDEV